MEDEGGHISSKRGRSEDDLSGGRRVLYRSKNAPPTLLKNFAHLRFLPIMASSSASPQPPATSSTALAKLDGDAAAEDKSVGRLVRRMEHCAKAREESTKILSFRYAEREQVRASLQKEKELYRDALASNKKQGEDRWRSKLTQSPYLTDLCGVAEKMEEEQKIRQLVSERKEQILDKRKKDAHTTIFQRALLERDEVGVLRAEKRDLMYAVTK